MPLLRRCLLAVVLVALPAAAAPAASSAATVSGVVFEDADRDGTPDAGEARWAGRRVAATKLADGTQLPAATTDAEGRFAFTGLADGAYEVRTPTTDWWALRDAWVPTTTGTLRPRRVVTATGTTPAAADLGWRRIVTNAPPAAPLSTATGPEGLRVDSRTDALDAGTVRAMLLRGAIGPEAPHVRVTVGPYASSLTTSSAGRTDGGAYEGFSAVASVAYDSFLDGDDTTLAHEYGHAWSFFRTLVLRQDDAFSEYVAARGLAGDARVGSSTGWTPSELVAEDYRQLLGSPTARTAQQANRELPAAAAVPGLREFLVGTFSTPLQPEPPAPAPVAVTGLAVNPATVVSSATVGFTLSAPAAVTVRVLSAKGVNVRTLMDRVARDAGAVTTTWDRTDARGRRAGKGTYRVVVDATDALGRTATATASFFVG